MIIGTRRSVLAAGVALTLAACGGAGGGAAGEDASDMAMGDANAPLKLIEYASLTCGHCAAFHAQTWPKLKENYVDTGKVRFVFREFPTAPAEVAIAGFQVARCNNASPDRYFAMVGTLFDQQQQIFEALNAGTAREKMLLIAQSAGISEEQFNKCVNDPEGMKRVQATVDKGDKNFKISGTPTLVLNGEVLPQKYLSYEELSKLLDTKLAGK